MAQRTSEVVIVAQNAMANAAQAQSGAFSANNFGVEPQVEDLSRIIHGGQEAAQEPEPTKPKALFGTHLREAAAIVKDWVKHP